MDQERRPGSSGIWLLGGVYLLYVSIQMLRRTLSGASETPALGLLGGAGMGLAALWLFWRSWKASRESRKGREEASRPPEEDPAALAASLLDGLEGSWQGLSPRRRKEARGGTRQMLALYLSPLLLDLGDQPAGRRLAETIREAWLTRFPKEPYTVTDHTALEAGFRDTIMGIEVHWHS